MSTELRERTGGKILIDALVLHGVDTVFAVPGESYLEALDALNDVSNHIRLVTCRQEGGACYMAEAYGKLESRPGVCFVTRGPGACNASIGIHTAMQDSTPMVVFIGQVERGHKGREAFQEIDYKAMFGSVAKWVAEIDDPRRIPEIVHRAFATAASGRPGPVVVSLPEDMLTERCTVHDGRPYQAVRPHPGGAEIDRMIALLRQAERPLMIVGGSGWTAQASADVGSFAEANAIPVLCSFRRQDSIGTERPVFVGDLGTTITPATIKRLEEADLLLVVGARLGEMTTRGYTLLETPAPKQTMIHVHADPDELGRVFQPDLGIVAGTQEFGAALRDLPPLAERPWASWTEEARKTYLEGRKPKAFDTALDLGAVMTTLDETLPDDTIIAIDAGNFSGWPQRFWRYRAPKSLVGPTNGSMGYGVPGGIAAKIAEPDRTVVTFVGDGGFMMTGQELSTAVAHNVNVLILVFNNSMYGTIRMYQENLHPGRIIGTDLTNPDFAALARAYGAHGETVEQTAEFAPALDRALKSGKPAVIELKVSQEIISTFASLTEIRARVSAAG
ncbi:MAG: thiamine pyrophosphate-binding protein [Rhodospirillaceae bacterium]|nr:thiamine pyrophosphate-binding protein [Rhodospirillaceae bacterium]